MPGSAAGSALRPHHRPMIGTFFRFLLLRVIGARGAAVLGALAFVLGRRRRQTRGYGGSYDKGRIRTGSTDRPETRH